MKLHRECPVNVASIDELPSDKVFCLKISVRLTLDNAVFTASEMAVDIVAESAFTSKETNPGLIFIVGSGTCGSVAVSSEVRTRFERVWWPILDVSGRFFGGITYR